MTFTFLSIGFRSLLSVSPHLAKTLGPYEFMVGQFLHIHHNTIHYTEIERYNCQFGSGLRKGVSFGEEWPSNMVVDDGEHSPAT